MKKIILGGALCFMFTNTFADYIRSATNGGPNGYNEVKTVINGGNTSITCKDPGYEVCPTSSYNSSEQPAIDYAINQITQGILSGSATIQGVTVIWQSSDRNMTNSNITVR